MQIKKFAAAAVLAAAATGAFAQQTPAAHPAAPHPVAAAAQPGHDQNTVSRDEYLKRSVARFEKLDANKDGNLSADERRADPHGRATAPVSREQFLHRAGLRFDVLDTNKDGQLTPDERGAQRHAAPGAAGHSLKPVSQSAPLPPGK